MLSPYTDHETFADAPVVKEKHERVKAALRLVTRLGE
jgi:hypothetical protein